MDKVTIGIISGVINTLAVIPYVLAIVKGRAKPSRVTWGIWLCLSLVILFASYASGARATLFWLVSATVNSVIIFSLSLWRGVWEKSKLELWCLALGVTGVVVWYITKKAAYSVYISSLVDAIAIIPTVKKTWLDPKSEPKLPWSLGICTALLNALAIDSFRPVIWIPPLVVIGWHVSVLIPMYAKRELGRLVN